MDPPRPILIPVLLDPSTVPDEDHMDHLLQILSTRETDPMEPSSTAAEIEAGGFARATHSFPTMPFDININNQFAAETALMESSASTAAAEVESVDLNSVNNTNNSQHNEEVQAHIQDARGHEHGEVSGVGYDSDVSDYISEAGAAISVFEAGIMSEDNLHERHPPNWPTTDQDVPLRDAPIDHFANFLEGGPDGPGGRAFIELSDEDKANVAFDMCLPGPREIRAIWSRSHQRWVYISADRPNTAPFVVKGFSGAMERLSLEFFSPAPRLGFFAPYKWFNYELDTLFLDFTHCTRTEAEREEFLRAIRFITSTLGAYIELGGFQPTLRAVRIRYCPMMFPGEELRDRLPALEVALNTHRVILELHDH